MTDQPRLTDEQKAAYAASSGPGKEPLCPYCCGTDLAYGSTEMVEGVCFQEAQCENCGRRWADRYEFAGIEEPEDS